MHAVARFGIVLLVGVALIIAGLFLGYSIQGGGDIQWLFGMTVALATAGILASAATWALRRKDRKEFKAFKDNVESRLMIRQFVTEEELARSVLPGDDR